MILQKLVYTPRASFINNNLRVFLSLSVSIQTWRRRKKVERHFIKEGRIKILYIEQDMRDEISALFPFVVEVEKKVGKIIKMKQVL